MRLSWNEIRTRAADFVREWADATYEKGETQSFYNEFFEIFGNRRRDVAQYEERVQRLANTPASSICSGPASCCCPVATSTAPS